MDRDDARPAKHYDELSADQLSELENVVKDFVANVESAGMESLDRILPMMGHGSHANAHIVAEGDKSLEVETPEEK